MPESSFFRSIFSRSHTLNRKKKDKSKSRHNPLPPLPKTPTSTEPAVFADANLSFTPKSKEEPIFGCGESTIMDPCASFRRSSTTTLHRYSISTPYAGFCRFTSHRRRVPQPPEDRKKLRGGEEPKTMEDTEFRGFLEVFPVIRSRSYCATESEPPKESTSRSEQNEVNEWKNAWDRMDDNSESDVCDADPFWQKLKSKAEKKVGSVEADKFCKAFQQVYKKLVFEEVGLDAARRFVESSEIDQID